VVENHKSRDIVSLPFLPQHDFDAFLALSDFLIVRGEDSLSRAALSGIPFLWQVYKNNTDKLQALLENMKPFFTEADFSVLENAFLTFNNSVEVIDITPLLKTGGFSSWAEKNLENGNLAQNLLDFISEIV
jgi:hypothetical protein